jgi:hypothetical protein
MKRIVVTLILIICSISLCEAQSIQEQRRIQEQQQQAAEAEKQRQQREADAERQRQQQAAAAQRQQEAAAREEQVREQERLRGMQLTLDNLFQLVNAETVASVNTFLSSREWELNSRNTGMLNEGYPETEITGWTPKSSLNNLPDINVCHFGSFDNLVVYSTKDGEHLSRLENDIKEREYQEISSGRALTVDADRADKIYRNDRYEVGFSYNNNLVSVLNYKDIEFYRAEVARLEQEAYERANQPATLHIYRLRNRNTIGGILGIVPRYEILLDNVVVGNTNSNWKTTVNVTTMGSKTAFANIEGRTANVQISFEPGGVYYLRSDISSRSINTGKTRNVTRNGKTTQEPITELQHTPTLQLVDRSIGEREFEAIR